MKKISSKKEPKEKTVLENANKHTSATPGFPIVGIGASAGGLEALEQFFENCGVCACQ